VADIEASYAFAQWTTTIRRRAVQDEYEDIRLLKQRRRSFATAELSDETVQAVSSSRMDERHAHLDALLEPK